VSAEDVRELRVGVEPREVAGVVHFLRQTGRGRNDRRGRLGRERGASGDEDECGASAFERVLPLVYDELHRMGARYLAGERSSLSFQATELVNELCLRLLGWDPIHWQNRGHFFGVSAGRGEGERREVRTAGRVATIGVLPPEIHEYTIDPMLSGLTPFFRPAPAGAGD
jgi:hypothetical protein